MGGHLHTVSFVCFFSRTHFLSPNTGHLEHGLLLFLPPGQVHLLYRIWSSTESGRATHERQVLELCLLQVYLCVWGDECSRDAGDVVLVCVVRCTGDTAAHGAALQG